MDDKKTMDLDKLAVDMGMKVEKTNNMCLVDYNYIASYLIEVRGEKDYEILDSNYISVNGSLDTDCYYSECVSEATVEEILGLDIIPMPSPLELGMFRYVVEAKCCGGKIWSSWGDDYDAWQEYRLISKTQLSEEEVKWILQDFEEQLHKFDSENDDGTN